MPSMHSLSVGLWIRTGGRYETKKNQGIAHFMEHMLFKGTKNRSCQNLKQAIEEKGGVFNAFTSEEVVCYYVKILSRHLSTAIDVLADMVLNPLFNKEDVEKERMVIFEEIRMYLDLPMQHVYDLLDELIWPGHSLGLSLLGTYETVKKIKRADLIERKEKFHTPSNLVAVACGDVSHKSFVNMVDSYFKKYRLSKRVSSKKATAATLCPRTNLYNKDTEQTHLCLGVKGLSRRDPQRFGLGLLNIILGGNMSSRLFNEIREKRSLAYEIGSSVKLFSDTGVLIVHAGVDNKKIVDAVSVIMKELKKIRDNLVTKNEFNMAKEYFRSGLLMGLEGTMANMLFLGEQMTTVNNVVTQAEALRELDKVNIEMINKVARRLFIDKNLKLAVIGPQETKKKKALEGLLYF